MLELRSESDSMKTLRAKMREHMANYARLGWLIDRKNPKVEIYRQCQDMDEPTTLSGEDVLAKFVLDLIEVWSWQRCYLQDFLHCRDHTGRLTQ